MKRLSPVPETSKDERMNMMNISSVRMNCYSPSCAHRGKVLEPSDVLQIFQKSFGCVKDVTDSDSFQTLNKNLMKAPSSFTGGLRCQECPDRENLQFISTTNWSLELNHIKSQGSILSFTHLNLKAFQTCERPQRMPRLEACRAAMCFSAVCSQHPSTHLATRLATLPTLRRFNPSGFPRCDLFAKDSKISGRGLRSCSVRLKVSLKDSCLTGLALSVSLCSLS